MKEFISTVNSKGQVTIPDEIRKYLGMTTNDKIGFVIDDEGVVRLRVPSLSNHCLTEGHCWSPKQNIIVEGNTKNRPGRSFQYKV